MRFGLIEFAFITGLKFGQYPTHDVLTEMSSSKRLLQNYLNGDVSSKLGDLEAAFLNYVDVEDCWKIGLCYLVEVVLLIDEPWSKVNIDLLSYVEDKEFVFQYPWGMDSYHKTLKRVDEDMVYYQNKYMESARKKRKGIEAKYAIYGYFFPLQYWAYDAIERLASKFVQYHDLQTPWMLSWSSDRIPSMKDLVEIFDHLL